MVVANRLELFPAEPEKIVESKNSKDDEVVDAIDLSVVNIEASNKE